MSFLEVLPHGFVFRVGIENEDIVVRIVDRDSHDTVSYQAWVVESYCHVLVSHLGPAGALPVYPAGIGSIL